jgi:hypothetical protein
MAGPPFAPLQVVDGPAPLQSVTGGGPLALVVTFLLASLFYAFTLHLAATFFIGDVPSQKAAYVGPVPAAVSILLQQYGLSSSLLVGVVIVATLVAELLAVSAVYRLKFRSAAPLVVLHFGFAAVMGVALANVLGVL